MKTLRVVGVAAALPAASVTGPATVTATVLSPPGGDASVRAGVALDKPAHDTALIVRGAPLTLAAKSPVDTVEHSSGSENTVPTVLVPAPAAMAVKAGGVTSTVRVRLTGAESQPAPSAARTLTVWAP